LGNRYHIRADLSNPGKPGIMENWNNGILEKEGIGIME
jgi:hypothetical protein